MSARNENFDTDLVDRIVNGEQPILCLDTCAILDLARDPGRNEVTENEQLSSLSLLERVRRGELTSVTTETVHREYWQNAKKVREETEEGVLNILQYGRDHPSRRKLTALVSIFDLHDPELEIAPETYAVASSFMSSQWLIYSIKLSETDFIIKQAKVRDTNNLAPSHHAGNALADCTILETYIWFANQCRVQGLPMDKRILFVSSNKRDFTRFGRLHVDIARSFTPLGMRYMEKMFNVYNYLFG